MPAISAGNCDPVENALRTAIEGPSDGRNVDDQLISSAKRVLLSKIDYHPAEKEYSSALKSLQSKYIHLNSSADRSEAAHGRKDDIHGAMTLNGSREDCRLDVDGIPIPRIVIHPLDNVKLGWLRVNKIGAGLANLGNTCFLNATLQCLTYTPPLVNHLIEFDEHSASCKNVGFCMMCELQRHIRQALKKHGEILRPHCILQKLKAIAAHMSWGRQEDAHEFLRYMMESMISFSLNGYTTSKLDKVSYETTVVNQIFGGYHRSQVICLRCKEKSDTYDHFMDIMLDIKNVPSLEKALEHFVQPEVLDSENAYMCPNCKQKCPAKKRFTIHRSPNITTFQLKRFDYTRSMGGKITKQISFPEKLDVRPYMSQRQGPPIMYALYAVLVHSGVSCNSGHYFCFVRNSNNLWYMMDDSKVRQVTLNIVLSQQAYLLFYTRTLNSGQLLKSPIQLQSPGPRLPLVSVAASSCSSASASNNGGSSMSNGIAAGNPVSTNDSFGIPIARKASLLGPGIVKPKPALSVVSSNCMAGPNSLPAHREKITFDFKLANNHGGVTANASAASTAKAAAYPGKAGGSATCNGPSAGTPATGGAADSTTPPKHPRIVMHIKNGKVYNCHSVWSPVPSAAGSAAAAAAAGDGTKVRSSLVPYAPDSSEESDQDTTNGRRSGSPRGALSNFPAVLNPVGKGCLDVATGGKRDLCSGGHLVVKLEPQLNATTQLPGLPKQRTANENPRPRDAAVKSEVDVGLPPTRKEDAASVCQLTVLTNTNCVSAGGVKVVNATTSQWLVSDGNQQSPSVASEGSNTSVNSTTGWSVHDAETGTAKATDRHYNRWTVTPVTEEEAAAAAAGLPEAARKKTPKGECGAKPSKCDKREGELDGGSSRRRNSDAQPPGEARVVCDDRASSNPSPPTASAVRECATGATPRTCNQLDAVPDAVAKTPRDGETKLLLLLPGSPAAGLCSKSKSSSLVSFGGSLEYKWTNGGLAGGDSRHQKRQHIRFDATATDDDGQAVASDACGGGDGPAFSRLTAPPGGDDHLPSAGGDSRLAPSPIPAAAAALTNGHGGQHTALDSPDEQQQPPFSAKRHKKKRKHKRDRNSPVDDEAKWKKKSGKRKDSESEAREGSSSPKKKKHSHSGSSSDGSYELEWVEKTKETLERESKHTTMDSNCAERVDTTVIPRARPQSADGGVPLRNGDLQGSILPSGLGDSGSNVVAELMKKGGRGFGEGVNSWDGGPSAVNRDVERESNLEGNRRFLEGYNDEFDRGKMKKVKPFPSYPAPTFQSNPFQRAQELKPVGRYFPNRWHSGSQSPYNWEVHHRGNHHYNRNRDGYHFHRKY